MAGVKGGEKFRKRLSRWGQEEGGEGGGYGGGV